ncbi:MAG: rhodanese-like domain-containing protein [Hyphomicrobiales bacterium]|uniref:rhodanese-like domain-containing protein n=1 Tax=Rhabdaerophilum calidifontis TaxID=2604328 RepID=UPI0012396ABF|nr:rhodanese-like domain-containing protein [Rhabdaerophilum calidifontis]MCA1951917.1 rhodanese-like domain-containing protein [Hyphomicrobiales bacterium]MCA1998707.1 rhodanese-like domain-containing protein [Hyphomicrobiales bacterium]
MPGIVDLDRDAVKAGLADGTLILVDVREPHEFAAGHIPGSLSLPLSRFAPSELPRLPGRRVVLSCVAGVRSAQALLIAQAAGIDVDSHYGGGFKDWLMAGEAVEQGG